jgi:hypothetical protein
MMQMGSAVVCLREVFRLFTNVVPRKIHQLNWGFVGSKVMGESISKWLQEGCPTFKTMEPNSRAVPLPGYAANQACI